MAVVLCYYKKVIQKEIFNMNSFCAYYLQNNGFVKHINLTNPAPNVGDFITLEDGTKAEFYNVNTFRNDKGEPMAFINKELTLLTQDIILFKISEAINSLIHIIESNPKSPALIVNKNTDNSPIDAFKKLYHRAKNDCNLPDVTANTSFSLQDAFNQFKTFASYNFALNFGPYMTCILLKAHVRALLTLHLPINECNKDIPNYPIYYGTYNDRNADGIKMYYFDHSRATDLLLK
jgi:hypothetical protein